MEKLPRKFFEQKTGLVARELLGKVLVRKIGKKKLAGMIVETEAYVGPHDLACHASKGKTRRNETMFSEAGTWYVYFIYGMYHCLNIITEAKDYPSAVFIRALEPLENIESSTNGPAKLCRALKIDRKLNSTSAVSQNSKLYIEDRKIKIPKSKIVSTKRIGVDYAGKWKDKPLRFYIKNNNFVSKR
jgi:DNA-3-methyladenine glycosylase